MAVLKFIKYQPVGLRLWHWLNATVITGLLLTVGLRRTLFRGRTLTQMIENKAGSAGTTIDHKLAREIANSFVDQLWQWHIYLGYALGILLLLRILVVFVHKESPLAFALRGFQQFKTAAPADKKDSLHYLMVRSGYLVFYLAVIFMVGSGLSMIFADELHLPEPWVNQIHDVHEVFQYFFLLFVIGHIAGVIWAELGRHRGLVSNMIHGGDRDH